MSAITERMLNTIIVDDDYGWYGDIGSPTGNFTGVTLTPYQINLIAAAEDVDYDKIAKYWIVEEFVTERLYTDFTNYNDFNDYHRVLVKDYDRWYDDEYEEDEGEFLPRLSESMNAPDVWENKD